MKQVEIASIPLRLLAGWTLAVMAVAGCFWLLFRFQSVVLLMLTAVILSTATDPAIAWLEKHRVPKTAGLLMLYGLVGLLVAVLIWQTLPVLAEQGAAISGNLSDGYRNLRDTLQHVPNIVLSRLLLAIPSDLSVLTEGASTTAAADPTLADTLTQSRQLLEPVIKGVTVLLLAFYWTLEKGHLKQAAFLLIPLRRRDDIRDLVDQIEQKLSSYLLGQGLLCLIIGAVAFLAYTLIGLPHALLLAVFAGLLEAVPVVGPLLGAVPALLVGLSVSPAAALWVIVATAVIQQLENSVLVPRVMKRSIGVSPLVTLLALLAFGSLLGVLGALLALPLAAVVQLLLDRYVLSGGSLERANAGRDRLSVLRYEVNQLVQDVRSRLRHKDEPTSDMADALEDEIEAIALELESILASQATEQGI